jgi:FlaA1/EpsC-like NDP-sugar epimerase
MGATKRIAELYVRSLNQIARQNPETRQHFSLVRFGNVLGSACSVLPIWTAQLAEGQPITVTHPDMTRYFMSIPEAAALVIQAATLEKSDSHGDEVFVLDMGEPVRIAELAERFIRSQGLRPRWEDASGAPVASPNGDRPASNPSPLAEIAIRFTGARPGEKLHEELAYQAEELARTSVPGILAWSGDLPDQTDVERILRDLQTVRNAAQARPVLDAIRAHIPNPTHLNGICSVAAASAA